MVPGVVCYDSSGTRSYNTTNGSASEGGLLPVAHLGTAAKEHSKHDQDSNFLQMHSDSPMQSRLAPLYLKKATFASKKWQFSCSGWMAAPSGKSSAKFSQRFIDTRSFSIYKDR